MHCFVRRNHAKAGDHLVLFALQTLQHGKRVSVVFRLSQNTIAIYNNRIRAQHITAGMLRRYGACLSFRQFHGKPGRRLAGFQRFVHFRRLTNIRNIQQSQIFLSSRRGRGQNQCLFFLCHHLFFHHHNGFGRAFFLACATALAKQRVDNRHAGTAINRLFRANLFTQPAG